MNEMGESFVVGFVSALGISPVSHSFSLEETSDVCLLCGPMLQSEG
jgi:hypothetical protein